MERTVKLDEEATNLLFEARKKALNQDPKEQGDWYNIIKIALKKYLEENHGTNKQ